MEGCIRNTIRKMVRNMIRNMINLNFNSKFRFNSIFVMLVIAILITTFTSCCVQVSKEPMVKKVCVTLKIKFSEDADNLTVWTEDKTGNWHPVGRNDTLNETVGTKGLVWLFCNISIENATVYGVLSESARKGNFSIESYYDSRYGSHFVTSIGGVKGDERNAWQYWHNGNYGQVGASLACVNNGDVIEWRYISYG